MQLTKRPLMALTCLLITAIIIVSRFYKPKYPEFADANSKICQGWLYEPPRVNEEGDVKLFVQMEGCKEGEILKPVAGRVRLTVAGASFSYGDRIRFQASLKPPVNFKNPGSFNFKRYCFARKIDALGFIADPRWVTKIGVVEGHRFRKLIERARERIASSLDVIEQKDVRAVSKALLIGEGSSIPENIREDFRMSGLMHLLVISGLNVGFVAVFVFFFFRMLLSFIPRLPLRVGIFKPSALLTIVAVWAFAYIAGAEVSVIRAAIMATVILAGIVLDKRQDIFTSLSLAALIILADSPFAVYDISFQLSFVAVLAIVLIYPMLAERFRILQTKPDETFTRRIYRYTAQTFAVSASATIGVSPLLAYYFHSSSVIGIFANILAVPWAGAVVTPLGLVISFIGAVSPKFSAALVPFWSWTVSALMKFASFSAEGGKFLMISYTPPKLAVIMFYHVVIFTALRKYLRHAKIAIGVCGAVLFTAIILHSGVFSPKRLEVDFLDVGQGSSAVVRLPEGKVIVIDGGGQRMSDFDIGKFVLAPYLWHEGITKVDALVATHAHSDHYKGLGYLAEEFKPKIFLWNGNQPEEDEREGWDMFTERVKRAGVPVSIVKRGAEFLDSEKVKFDILNPPEELPRDWNMNDSSLVTKVSYGTTEFLLTGDIEAEAEQSLVVSRQSLVKPTTNDQRPTTVLQVSHHGSSTSSTFEFLTALQAEYAVIQCGENNHYGFPTGQTLSRLEKAGAKVFRTDIDGAVEIKSDGKNVKIKKFVD